MGWIWTEGGFDSTKNNNNTGVRIYQSSVNQNHVDRIRELLTQLVPTHKEYQRVRSYKGRSYTEHQWYFSGPQALWVRSILPDKKPTWDLLWKMSWEEKQRFLNASLCGDGSVSDQECAFYQKDKNDLIWMQTLSHLMGKRSLINYNKSVVSLCDRPQTQLQLKHLRINKSEPYNGTVWCVKTPTGAFLAKRKDRIFITGNSGFPKSMNMEKVFNKKNNPQMAELYKGFGTALKPAFEPIVTGSKPNQYSFPF